MSTTQLLQQLGQAQGATWLLLTVPSSWLRGTTAAAALSGAVIGFAGHGQISTAESVALTLYSAISFVLVMVLRSEK